MATDAKTIEAKLVLLGDSGFVVSFLVLVVLVLSDKTKTNKQKRVGKTSIAIRFVQGVFSEDQPSTIGASFFTKRLFVISPFFVSSTFG